MTISLRNKQENRAWTLKEWVTGRPLGHPSHPLFVHYPIAFYSAVISFDILTRIEPNAGLVQAGTFLIIGAAVATILAATTGLVDWWGMVPGSSKRKIATRHLLLQLTTAGFFVVVLFLRWPHRTEPQADVLWIVLEAIGYGFLVVGQYLGGVLVYEKAMRVSTGGATD